LPDVLLTDGDPPVRTSPCTAMAHGEV